MWFNLKPWFCIFSCWYFSGKKKIPFWWQGSGDWGANLYHKTGEHIFTICAIVLLTQFSLPVVFTSVSFLFPGHKQFKQTDSSTAGPGEDPWSSWRQTHPDTLKHYSSVFTGMLQLDLIIVNCWFADMVLK